MGLEPALLVHAKADGPRLHLLRRLRQRHPPRRPRRRPASSSASTRCCRPRRSTGDQVAAAPQARRRRRLHRHRRPHRRHRRDPQHQGLRGGEGPGVLPRDQGREPRRPGARARARRPGPGREGGRRPGSARSSRSGTPTSTTRRRCGRPSARRTPRGRCPLLIVGGPRFEERLGSRARRRPDLRPRHHPRRGRQLPRPRPDARHRERATPS